ncbi:DUF5403 family protein [Streptomyces fructofermentans]|uniref:Uncharacterized protein n=1 Tax=Streptomyces fructofermentans TaxID=152141 RepID=A0A918NVT8_9ACTN|nr:DUF5403 family protein [Streptomyces fructofermentans]GGX98559.1 hypothetical protein GCM10010515_75960 [Streptomyces fructofermentans]
MASVDRNLESYLAHLPTVRAAIRALAEERAARMRAVAAARQQTGTFARSFKVEHGSTDSVIYSTDPAALSKNYGHTAPDGTAVEGVHAFEAGIS